MTTDQAPDSCPQCGYSAPGDAPEAEEEEEEYYIDPVHGVNIIPIKDVELPTEEERKRVTWIGFRDYRR